jgi:fructose-bisphosphate aldolase class I
MTTTDQDSRFPAMLERARDGQGFIAALDQSGGSTPKALAAYGVPETAYQGEAEMFDVVHAMRTRIMTSPSFTGDKVIGAILFEGTMDREVEGVPTSHYLWSKGIVPYVKCDQGMVDEADGVQLMKPIPSLDALLARARGLGVFGTKMRSVVARADEAGIRRCVAQQFEVGAQIIAGGLCPILEPEVLITSPDKEAAEAILHQAIADHLDQVPAGDPLMLKLSIPTVDGLYSDLMTHPAVVRVVALSGGYPAAEANERLSRNPGLIASFSRTIVEDLSADQSAEDFDAALARTIDGIYQASLT